MSINVTVSGNPIKIHRGKLLTSDLQDVDKRRKIRLQQVRQQSKDLAASVRNNVKKVRNKQQTDFEKQNQAKLKEWQNKKLLQMQHVYEDNVKEIGAGHAQAQRQEIEEIEQMERQKIINDEMASRRGRSAQELLQVKKNEASLQKAIPRQAKQLVREVENARAAMIVNQSTHRTPKKKKVTKGSFTIVEHDDEVVPDEEDIDNIDNAPAESKSASKKSNVSNSALLVKKKMEDKSSQDGGLDGVPNVPTVTSVPSYQRPETPSAASKSPVKRFRHEDTSRVSLVSIEVPPDTRISDRIRSRHLVTAPMSDIPEALSASPSNVANVEYREQSGGGGNKENTHLNRSKTFSTATHQGVSIPPVAHSDVITCPMCVRHLNPLSHACREQNNVRSVCVPPIQTCVCPHLPLDSAQTQAQAQHFEIPSKPTVSLSRESYHPQYSKEDVNSKKDYRRVRSFDRSNRFGHHYVTDTSQVHRVSADELQYCDQSDVELEAGPSHRNNRQARGEFTKLADERAKMADVRGRQALQKENIHKDYQHLMKKLPLLQKQGRIANLSPSKDKLHMSDDRRKEHEKLRQQRMERAFERLAPTTTITLPSTASRNTPRKKSPRRRKSKSPPKSFGTWRKTSTTDASNNAAAATTETSETSNLIGLLEKLRSQKEELLKECKELPEDSNFYTLIDDLDFVTRTRTKNKDKQIQTQTQVSVQTKTSSSSDVGRKVHKQVLILQNTSTQTSPKVSNAPTSVNPESTSGSDAGEPPIKQPKTSSQKGQKGNTVCACKDRDKLCEILIKIRDCPAHSAEKSSSGEKTPEVVVNHANRLEESLNLETGKCRKTSHTKSNDSDKSISPKRSRSESPKKNPRKVETGSNDNWKHQLSSGSTRLPDEMTTSTSYYSPPDYGLQQGRNRDPRNGSQIQTSMPQTQDRVPLDNRLLGYINKMLEVSKGKLNVLAANVSSISDVPTPGSSIIDIRSNRPQRQPQNASHNDSTQIEKLSTLLKYFNLTPGDFRSFVSVASASSAPRSRSNSVGSSSTQSHDSRGGNMRSVAEDQVRDRNRDRVDSTHLSLENYTQTASSPTGPVMDHFAQWAEICQTRISNLNAMIDKVRMEKQEIISPTASHHGESLNKSNNATTYMSLPTRSASTSPRSPEQRQLNAQLLDVASQGTNTTNARDREEFQLLLELSKTQHDLDRDMVERYMKLVGVELQAQRTRTPDSEPTPPKSPEKEKGNGVTFKPMLDIPKLPKFQPQPSTSNENNQQHTKLKKPPVTNNALRFNDVIHELSAIPEAENSRLSRSPQSRKSASPQKRMVPVVRSPTKSYSMPSTSHDPRTKYSPKDQSSESQASDKSNESVESMLKTIGLDWAINNLKIMNAAHNNNSSSSSSSFELELKRFTNFVHKNISTSTSHNDELSRLQRTSTPVQANNSLRSQPSHRLINSGESELSPVASAIGKGKDKSDKSPCDTAQQTFNTMPSPSTRRNDESDDDS